MLSWDGQGLQRQFERARQKPWIKAYETWDTDGVDAGPLRIEGALPAGLHGVFYRNGPARHELGDARYSHRWDGDGMVQAFRFLDGRVVHKGRFVHTPKFVTESAAGRFLVSGFGSRLRGSPATPADLDELNTANINVCHHAGHLLALWEAGSAYRLDPDSLQTTGVFALPSGTRLKPFSAHPRIEPDGTLWNFGADPFNDVLSIYCFAPAGALKVHRQFSIDALPPIHDFAVTESQLVFVMPPLQAGDTGEALSFAQSIRWNPNASTRILTISKRDWTLRWYELPPTVVFHIGNAWEDSSGTIRLDYMGHEEPVTFSAGWMVMAGEYQHAAGPSFTTVEIDPKIGAVRTVHAGLECEFPVVDPSLVGRRYNRIVCSGRSKQRPSDLPGWDQVAMLDVRDGFVQSYLYGDDWLVEEHIYVPDASRQGAPAKWLLGTALNMRQGRTALSVFDVDSLSAGPLARVWLPYSLPLGLHGTFRPTTRGA